MVCTYWRKAAVIAAFETTCVVGLKQQTPFRGRILAVNVRLFDILYAYVGPGDGA